MYPSRDEAMKTLQIAGYIFLAYVVVGVAKKLLWD